MSEIAFKADKVHRDRYFTAAHFSHPAKMILPLQRWIIENYTKPGEVILDPMAGSGTVLIACTMGRHVISVELEEKFVKMQRDNWAKIQVLGPELGYTMGTATILQGDARNLEGLLCDSIISSPPYASGGHHADQTGSWGGQAQHLTKEQANYGQSHGQIGQLPYGSINAVKDLQKTLQTPIDCVITSPPYEGTEARDRSKENWWDEGQEKKFSGGSAKIAKGYQVDSIITSPPYEGSLEDKRSAKDRMAQLERNVDISRTGRETARVMKKGFNPNTALAIEQQYSSSLNNIGNLKSDSYLSAMLLVYQSCHKVLKPSGLLILVTKNFIRDKQEVRLDLDTIKLCEQAGFTFVERHYWKLTSQSFWRVLYAQKYPMAPVLDREDILIFQKVASLSCEEEVKSDKVGRAPLRDGGEKAH